MCIRDRSKVYTEPIILREGTTELKAFGVNDKNIESDVISRKYVIVLNLSLIHI